MKKCDSCLKDFFAHELNEEKLCADCQALIQETFDEMEKEMPRYNSDLKELKTMLQTISNEDSRDAELLTDGDADILRGRAELAQSLIEWVEKKDQTDE